ncbi:uncharacterized protein LOC142345617 [Convolutriloba macropyga]|uniref:uncharacterized protein LOC142345617 n=1 Tax=Convolutriloba macropyga TaxID=536237 RepID=UPI003F52796B
MSNWFCSLVFFCFAIAALDALKSQSENNWDLVRDNVHRRIKDKDPVSHSETVGSYGSAPNCSGIGPYITGWYKDPCPCHCGSGKTTSRRYCVWYEEDDKIDGGCVEKRTNDEKAKHPCTGALTAQRDCFHGPCLINTVIQQTADIQDANTNSDFYYTAITKGGDVCDVGVLDLPNYDDRERRNIDVYPLSMPCDVCMKSPTEVFDKINVTIVDGSDGWMATWIVVEVNNIKQTYYNNRWVDSYDGKNYGPQETFDHYYK